MKKQVILNQIASAGVIAVVRGDSKEAAVKAANALVLGGIVGLEITYTVPDASQAISELRAAYQDHAGIVIGAGTVLDAITARLAIMSGATFIVSPTFDIETAEICNLYQIPYLPGCMTITEMKTALKAGVDIIKLFPGNVYDPSIISSFKAPLPQLNIMPTGGVSVANMADWFKAGVIAVGAGGNLLAPAASGDYAGVTAMAKQYAEKYAEISQK
ncbi:ketohydroxyglutarate aldolase [Lactococcus piscium]|uniref:Ketohydroxyglutarate aldolase n=1 Tax=Pseudolactococcus piscium TaxID=1364 RepID=A0A2A5S616_9LACT|nr:bifunctional 4-hydroxy-2-oxoglutarate aldolase/2-dehydro-3-deoxy-phosphogluconate aldolase [Lactococcus piscium]PCS08893.1 ketohydroxyglutarate aldolase [Lactococcus piscium]